MALQPRRQLIRVQLPISTISTAAGPGDNGRAPQRLLVAVQESVAGPTLPSSAFAGHGSYQGISCRPCRWSITGASDSEQPIVPAATKYFCKDIALFTQALMFKTSPDRFDH